MITIKTNSKEMTFNLNNADTDMVEQLCYRLEALWDRETNEVE
jgi:hypothetical protein